MKLIKLSLIDKLFAKLILRIQFEALPEKFMMFEVYKMRQPHLKDLESPMRLVSFTLLRV